MFSLSNCDKYYKMKLFAKFKKIREGPMVSDEFR